MSTLSAERCVACRRDAPRVTEAEVADLRRQIPDWQLVERDGKPRRMKSGISAFESCPTNTRLPGGCAWRRPRSFPGITVRSSLTRGSGPSKVSWSASWPCVTAFPHLQFRQRKPVLRLEEREKRQRACVGGKVHPSLPTGSGAKRRTRLDLRRLACGACRTLGERRLTSDCHGGEGIDTPVQPDGPSDPEV